MIKMRGSLRATPSVLLLAPAPSLYRSTGQSLELPSAGQLVRAKHIFGRTQGAKEMRIFCSWQLYARLERLPVRHQKRDTLETDCLMQPHCHTTCDQENQTGGGTHQQADLVPSQPPRRQSE